MSDLLTLTGVTRRFSGVTAVNAVSFNVPAGAIIALVGPNGAGKTTLLDLITGACQPDAGTIRFDGRDITGHRTDRLCAAGIARTFQQPRRFGTLSLADIVMIGALLHEPEVAEARRRTLELLDELGLAPWHAQPAACLNPAGLKRLELARALATRPRVLLLDEVLGGIPADEREGLLSGLQGLNHRHHLTILMAEADDGATAVADWTVTLDQGALIASGDPRETIASGDPRETVASGDPRETIASGDPRETIASGDPRETVASGDRTEPQRAEDDPS